MVIINSSTNDNPMKVGDLMKTTCGAKTRSGGTCQKPPLRNRSRCKLHGGKAPVAGPTHPAYKHGRYSMASIPKPLREFLEQTASDPELMSLRQEIMLVQSTIAASVQALGELPKDGPAPIEQYRRISDLCLKKASLVDSESKRLEQLGQMISAERAFLMIEDVIKAIKATVEDEAVIREIGLRLQSILGVASRNRTA